MALQAFLFLFLLPLAHGQHQEQTSSEPFFLWPVGNHTVIVGRDVGLDCVVGNLGPYKDTKNFLKGGSTSQLQGLATSCLWLLQCRHKNNFSSEARSLAQTDGREPTIRRLKTRNDTLLSTRNATGTLNAKCIGELRQVAWMYLERQMILSMHRHMITRISRFSVSHDNYRTWRLHISDVRREDEGTYMCQVNTEPMISQLGYINVVGGVGRLSRYDILLKLSACISDVDSQEHEGVFTKILRLSRNHHHLGRYQPGSDDFQGTTSS
ncbi:unnamed protein product [Darwinula stevensoni]|uniref:Immunoglobulin domain-containing protein n=1 Tax=Darwinula stevensoni TaxID=69355 RepID=A0A7R8XLN6_9CRUS|nr:unnamed protein product [Darwinula stevensoni]CAG0894475.1 unnamed protein product [Darwinula stevensoni]